MKNNTQPYKLTARFGRPTRFDLTPSFHPLDGEFVRTEFERLKGRLLKPVLNQTPDAIVRKQFRLAANEAAAVAWTTPFPLLLLPVLLEEKADEVRQYALRQEQVQQANPVLAADSG